MKFQWLLDETGSFWEAAADMSTKPMAFLTSSCTATNHQGPEAKIWTELWWTHDTSWGLKETGRVFLSGVKTSSKSRRQWLYNICVCIYIYILYIYIYITFIHVWSIYSGFEKQSPTPIVRSGKNTNQLHQLNVSHSPPKLNWSSDLKHDPTFQTIKSSSSQTFEVCPHQTPLLLCLCDRRWEVVLDPLLEPHHEDVSMSAQERKLGWTSLDLINRLNDEKTLDMSMYPLVIQHNYINKYHCGKLVRWKRWCIMTHHEFPMKMVILPILPEGISALSQSLIYGSIICRWYQLWIMMVYSNRHQPFPTCRMEIAWRPRFLDCWDTLGGSLLQSGQVHVPAQYNTLWLWLT